MIIASNNHLLIRGTKKLNIPNNVFEGKINKLQSWTLMMWTF